MKNIIQATVSIEANNMEDAKKKLQALESIAENFTVNELKTIARAVKIDFVKNKINENLKAFTF